MTESEIRLEARDLNQQAAMLIQAGNFESAQLKIEKAIELDPMLVDSYKNKGDLYVALEQYTEAKNAYKKALLIEKSGLLYFLYGNVCFLKDEVHEGLEHYNLAITNGYDSEEMMYFMGLAYEHLNDDNMALRYFQKACNKNVSRPDYQMKRIATLIRLGMVEAAEAGVDAFLMKFPEMFDGYHLKTKMLIQKKEYKEAIDFAKGATDRFPEDVDLCYDYVHALALGQNTTEALKEINTAKKMKYYEDSKREFIILEAQIYAELNDFEKAISCCNECISIEGKAFDAEARFMLMNLWLSTPDYQKALDFAKEIINKDAEDLYYYAALYYRAFCAKQLGHIEESRKFYKEANSIYRLATLKNPAAIDIYLYRAMCMKDIENYDKALELLDFIAGLNNQVAEVHTIRADIYRIQGRKSLAEEEIKKAYQIKPELNPNTEGAGE